jgi:arylsulfatase A-like enzyme/Tfp pilus assembly protein PilF
MLGILLALAVSGGPPDVLIVTIDTLRADRVGAYGHAGADTPALDRLAREGVLLEDAVVQIPQTRPSHASMFTGRYPFEHGIRDNVSPPLPATIPTLATLLRRAGYETAGFIGAYPVARPSGLDQGFTTFDDPFGAGETATSREARSERRGAETVDRALAWLGTPRGKPFFLWIHLFDPHAPYDPPAPFRSRFARRPYDGEVAYADAQLARLLAWLDRTRRRAQTFVVVTSDHGEGLGDHGESEHMFLVYDSTLKVPLVLSWPGRLDAGARVKGQFRSVDLFPTLLELLGLPVAPSSGVSRAAVLRAGGRIADNESYAESLYGSLHYGYAPLRALRAEGWKYVDAPRAELYRVAEDPMETRNLLEARPQVASAMRARLRTYEARAGDERNAAVDSGAAERLASLGYLGGGFFTGKPSGADPKDKLKDFEAHQQDMREALRLYRARDLDAAIRLFSRLARGRATSFNVEYYLGRSLLERHRPAAASPHLEKAAELAPASAVAWVFLADAYSKSSQPARALEAVDRGLRAVPDHPELLAMRGRLLLQQGDTAAARAALEKSKSLDPRDARVHVDLANLYRGTGDLARARAEAEEALRLDPKSAEAQVAWGLVLGALGREPEAAQAFRAALKLKPDQPDALFYLGSVELRAGRAAAAVRLFERLLRRAPSYPGAEASLAIARARAVPATALPRDGVALRLIRVRDRSRADAAARRAAAGEDFGALAREMSEDATAARGGDLGYVRPADLAEPLRSAAAGLAAGRVSAVLETPGGYVILMRER